MKKLVIILLVAVAFFSLTQMAVADQVTLISSPQPYQTGSGGEFTMLASGATLLNLISSYDPLTKNVSGTFNTFQTFCIELGESVGFGGVYNAFLNDRAIYGGVGSAGDPISIGTAYLYYQFATGALSGYNYGLGRIASAGELQQAIWFLEDEGGVNNSFVAAAISQFGGTLEAAKADNNGAYGVMALNLYNQNGSVAQDVLIITRVPEPITMLLLGLGLIGVAGIRRKYIS